MSDARHVTAIIDAHQHFWDLDANYYPWLQDPEPIAFRYGDYSALKRNYLPADFRRDMAPYQVVKTVHIEAEWDRARPVAETEWLQKLSHQESLPTACVAHAAICCVVVGRRSLRSKIGFPPPPCSSSTWTTQPLRPGLRGPRRRWVTH